MTTALIAIAAALALCVLVLLALLAGASRRAARLADAHVSEAVETLNERLDELGRELAAARERADEEARRSRLLGELTTSIDLDDVLARTLEAALALPGADAALTTLRRHDGKPVVATRGLSAEEAENQTIAGPPDGRPARSVAFAYRYGEDAEGAIHNGVAVPVGAESGEVGHLAVFSRTPGHVFGDDVVDRLEEIAGRAGPAIDNARRFREARQLADLDALTGLHNRRYFHETLARECVRAHRYDRRLALVVLDLDDFKDVNDRIGHLAGDAVLAELAERIRAVVRSADIACRVGGDEFAVILPESSLEEAEQLSRRIDEAVSGRSLGQGGTLHVSAGVTELRRDDDAPSFFERADEALYRAKEQGKGRVVATNAH